MARIHNFSAGPAVLPETVVQETQQALWELGTTGLGLAELSHRSKAFDEIAVSARSRLHTLLGCDDDQEVLFLQGGASSQFFMIPMNLLRGARATYLDTGRWSSLAAQEAARFGTVDIGWSSAGTVYDHVPEPNAWGALPEGTVYLHYTSNNTVAGSEYHYVPNSDGVPLVCDASSDILSRPIDGTRFALLYAGAQKNLGPSGVTVVVVRKSLIERMNADLPTMLRYGTHVKKASMHNTPSTIGIFMIERVCAWIEAEGGTEALGARNAAKAAKVYQVVDGGDFWQGKVRVGSRSNMNLTFTTGSAELDGVFVASATQAGLAGLKGHKSVGGLRASLYNACPDASVDALVAFMREFERIHG